MLKTIKTILLMMLFLSGLFLVNVQAEALELYAQSAVLVDGDTGRVLFGKNQDEIRAMASTTKIMTCILVLEQGNLDETATVSARAAGQPKVHLGTTEGQRFYVKDLLYSLMLESHNDAAVILAEKTAGSVETFAEMMNKKAEAIGCENTHFVTPNGLDDSDAEGAHVTTAQDLARILCYCIKQSPVREQFLEITQTLSYSFSDIDGTRSYSCANHNAFLGMMDGALTGKTGFTAKAGYCYVGALESEGRTFVVALLGCGWPNNRNYKWSDTKKLMSYGMENYQYCSVNLQQDTGKIQVENGIPESGNRMDQCYVQTCVEIKGTDSLQILTSNEDKIEAVCYMKKELKAPVKSGQSAGELKILLNGKEICRRKIVTKKGVGEVTYPWCAKKILGRFLGL